MTVRCRWPSLLAFICLLSCWAHHMLLIKTAAASRDRKTSAKKLITLTPRFPAVRLPSPLAFGDVSRAEAAWAGVLHFSSEPVWPGSRFPEPSLPYHGSNGTGPCSGSSAAQAHPGSTRLSSLAHEHVRGGTRCHLA